MARQQALGSVCIPGKCCLFERAVFTDGIALWPDCGGPAASEFGGGPHPVEGLEQHVVSAGIQQRAVEVAVDDRPLVRIVGITLLLVRCRACESMMCCAHPGLPLEVASFDGEPQHGRLEDRPGLRELLPPVIGYRRNRKTPVGQPLRQPFSHEPQKRFSSDREAYSVFVCQLLGPEGLPGWDVAVEHRCA
jgi:hypothetical protein